jgi:hypothetical protein
MPSLPFGPQLARDAHRQAAILLANMIESYLDKHDPLLQQEVCDEPLQNFDATSTEEGVRVRSPIDSESGDASSGKHQTSIRSQRQSYVTRLAAESDSNFGP